MLNLKSFFRSETAISTPAVVEPAYNMALSEEIEAMVSCDPATFIAHFDLDYFVSRVEGERVYLSNRAWDFIEGLFKVYAVPPVFVQKELF